MKIAFIGLGNMGEPMAANLVKAGFDLNIHDVDRNKAESLVQAGAHWADSIQAAVSEADVVMTSLPSPAIIKQVASAEDGLIAHIREGAIWIELSTNNLDVWRDVRELAASKQVRTLDAPISGGAEGAAAGTLTVLVGGDQATFDECQPIFSAIGKRIDYLGEAGAGYVAKIAQVVLCYLHSVALSEALMLGVKGGVPADKMLAIIQNSTGRSYVADRYGPSILNGDYDPTFELGLALKDMRLTLELAGQVMAELPMCRQVEQMYGQAVDQYGGKAPHLMAVKLLEQANDKPLRG
ncbi:NAD(P)-dependent oxidoreductase [Cobetia amphilecti]|uniref:NAD(P)-dependent oxidoreductase n=2 Tax=Pseudomonadota TaxID=1224 RepID=UPI001C08C93D|nr:NAD(P)-dependent oxidoreductase [Cobetia amphilecti]MBU3007724.1 NAD(P)-dependent oxidoreductase [Cobetia amphilecti]MDO6815115.1 NAD(P)-dependent oxidoreductase [Cobetia amphilecti]